ncbi:MAG: nodulation protein NfeD, partial [Acidobacteriota bacterium]
PVVLAVLNGSIHPITAEFVTEALKSAQARKAGLFLLQLSTPGGLDQSMRDIMQAFLASPIPVCVWVAPQGVRAASAGFMIALSADLVVMAPGTNMGSAHPVGVGGQGMDETMKEKVTNDAVAYARSVAEQRGRPPDLAAEAVSKNRSFTASEAVDLGLADLLVGSIEELQDGLDGRVIRRNSTHPLTLHLAGAEVVRVEMSLRQRVLSILANPEIAYILLLGGLVGLYFELSSPGAILPGVAGAISLVMGMLALQLLPINYAGLALLGLAVIFFILEFNVVSYGLLTVAGLVTFVLGSLLLFNGPIPEMRLQLSFVLPVAFVVLGLAGLMTWMVLGAHRGRVHTGPKGLISEVGRAMSDLGPGVAGRVFVHGELWWARSGVNVEQGEMVEVVSIDPGLVVRVRPSQKEKRS